jgi:hypothetical protein
MEFVSNSTSQADRDTTTTDFPDKSMDRAVDSTVAADGPSQNVESSVDETPWWADQTPELSDEQKIQKLKREQSMKNQKNYSGYPLAEQLTAHYSTKMVSGDKMRQINRSTMLHKYESIMRIWKHIVINLALALKYNLTEIKNPRWASIQKVDSESTYCPDLTDDSVLSDGARHLQKAASMLINPAQIEADPSQWVIQDEYDEARDKFAINHIAIVENYKVWIDDHENCTDWSFTEMRYWRNRFSHFHNVAFHLFASYEDPATLVPHYERVAEKMKQPAHIYNAKLSDPTAWEDDTDYARLIQVDPEST